MYIGTWFIPLLITLVSCIYTAIKSEDDKGGYMSGLETGFRFLVSIIVSLLAWLIWALV